jgi:hypothetical protein
LTVDNAKRNSRVHFSPELVQNHLSERHSQDPFAAASKESSDDDIGEELSPVAKSQSPSPSVASEEKTLGTTPPSILRTEPTCNDDDEVSDDGNARLSLESEKSENSSGSRRSTRRSTYRKAEPAEAIESEETMTTSETPLSADLEDEPETQSPGKKRKTNRTTDSRVSKKSKKTPPVKIDIKLGVVGKKKSSRRGRKAKVSSNVADEFAFSDDDDKNKENDTKRRSRKRAASPVKKKAQQKTKISMGSSKTSRRTRQK